VRDNRDPKLIGKWLLRNRKPTSRPLHIKANQLIEKEIDDFKETRGQVTGRAVR